MAKVDFITLAKIIFGDIDKNKYKYISDEEKEDTFFMLNRKYAYFDIKKAQFFNNKNVNRASAMDIWYQIFYNSTGTPKWWWLTSQKAKIKTKSEFSNVDIKLIKEYYDIKDNDVKFLIKFYSEKLKDDIKRLKKFKKE
jgi:hypothetical protein